MVARFVPTSRPAQIALLLIVAGWLVAGVLLGRAHAWNQSVAGMAAAFGGIVFVVGAIGLLVFWIAAAIVQRVVRAPKGAAAGAARLAVIGLVLGGGVGFLTAPFTGGTYVAPVFLESVGTTNATITSPTATFVPRTDGRASCVSVENGEAVASVTAGNLGELGSGTLGGYVTFESASQVYMELSIDGADAGDGLIPTWAGRGSVVSTTINGLAATVAFEHLTLVADPGLPAPPREWTGALSGTLGWACEPLSSRESGLADPPEEVLVDLEILLVGLAG